MQHTFLLLNLYFFLEINLSQALFGLCGGFIQMLEASEAEGEGSVGQVGEQVHVRTAAPYCQHLQTSREPAVTGGGRRDAFADSPCAPCCCSSAAAS